MGTICQNRSLSGYRISRLYASRLRFPPGLSEFESHVQPLCRGRAPCQPSKAAKCTAPQDRAARRRSHDDGIVVMHVLRLHRDMPGYQAAQTNREWCRTTIVRPELDPKPPFASINSNAGPCPKAAVRRSIEGSSASGVSCHSLALHSSSGRGQVCHFQIFAAQANVQAKAPLKPVRIL